MNRQGMISEPECLQFTSNEKFFFQLDTIKMFSPTVLFIRIAILLYSLNSASLLLSAVHSRILSSELNKSNAFCHLHWQENKVQTYSYTI